MRRIAITILLCISVTAAAILGLPNYKAANAIKAATDDLVSQTDGMQMTIDQYNQQPDPGEDQICYLEVTHRCITCFRRILNR